MFWTRLVSGVILIIIALATIISGGNVLDIVLCIISCIGFTELLHAFGVQNEKKSSALKMVGYIGIVAWYGMIGISRIKDYDIYRMEMLLALLVFFGCMFLYVFSFPKLKSQEITETFFCFMYAPVMLSFIDMTRNLNKGIYIVWLIFISAWGCDTCAYCSGVLFGKHKMSPILSPKKSIEGAVGGVIGAAIIGAIYALLVASKVYPEKNMVLIFSAISAAGAMISMVGDLAASAIKRDHAIKDYGKLIPGHGGIMDRFDSIIFTAPATYFLAVLFFQGISNNIIR